MRLTASFYEQYDTIGLAQALLGCTMVHQSADGLTICRIVETEAYLNNDPASHSYKGQTARNASMFAPAGTFYVYLIYGMYYCVNVVSKEAGEAVLIRAAEPIEGIELMRYRRSLHPKTSLPKHSINPLTLPNLCNGPGKLAQAMGFTRAQHDSLCLCSDARVYLEKDTSLVTNEIVTTTRIGITQGSELPYRFLLKDNPYISVKPRYNSVI